MKILPITSILLIDSPNNKSPINIYEIKKVVKLVVTR